MPICPPSAVWALAGVATRLLLGPIWWDAAWTLGWVALTFATRALLLEYRPEICRRWFWEWGIVLTVGPYIISLLGPWSFPTLVLGIVVLPSSEQPDLVQVPIQVLTYRLRQTRAWLLRTNAPTS